MSEKENVVSRRDVIEFDKSKMEQYKAELGMNEEEVIQYAEEVTITVSKHLEKVKVELDSLHDMLSKLNPLIARLVRFSLVMDASVLGDRQMCFIMGSRNETIEHVTNLLSSTDSLKGD